MKKSRVAALAALAVTLVLAGCGSSSSSSKSSTGASSGPSSNAPSGDPIKVGMICACTGFAASSQGALPALATVWSKFINDGGGINGHPVKVIVVDNGGDASKSALLVRQLVEQDGVVAIVDEDPVNDAGWADYVSKKGIPVTGGLGYTLPMTTDANFFPSNGNLAAATYGLGQGLKEAGVTKVAVLPCAEAPVCAGIGDQLQRISDAVGFGVKVVYTSKIPATAASYAPQCLAAKSAGATGLWVGHVAQTVQNVVDQCVQQGFRPKIIVEPGSVVGNTWAKDSNLEGVFIAQYHLPVTDGSTEGSKEFLAAVQKYNAGLTSADGWSEEATELWSGLQLFAAAAKAANVSPTSTGADVKKGIYAVSGTTLGGLTGPLKFTPNKPTQVNCYYKETIKSGAFATLGSNQPICLDDATADKVNKAFTG